MWKSDEYKKKTEESQGREERKRYEECLSEGEERSKGRQRF